TIINPVDFFLSETLQHHEATLPPKMLAPMLKLVSALDEEMKAYIPKLLKTWQAEHFACKSLVSSCLVGDFVNVSDSLKVIFFQNTHEHLLKEVIAYFNKWSEAGRTDVKSALEKIVTEVEKHAKSISEIPVNDEEFDD